LPTIRRLQRRVIGVIVVQWMALTGLFALFCFLVAPLWGLQGWLAAAPVLGVVHWVLWKHLAASFTTGSPPIILGIGGRQHDHRFQGMADQRAGWHRPHRRGKTRRRPNGSFGSRDCVTWPSDVVIS
jgi:hypothetical protein